MHLRTKIFRQLVLFALVPSLIITAVALYLLSVAVGQAGSWLSATAPDRTINSLRLLEAHLQDFSREYLRQNEDEADVGDGLILLDWSMTVRDGRAFEHSKKKSLPPDFDSVLATAISREGPLRRIVASRLVLGYAVAVDGGFVAAGFALDPEYLSGLEAATSSLSERRGFKNVLPGFTLFLATAGAVVLILVVILASVLSRRLSISVTAPLEQLAGMTAEMSRGRRTDAPAVGGTDEVRGLLLTFNRMFAELEENRRRLIAAERVAAWQEFARRMAHELKNPLTPISLSLYRIKKKLTDSGDYAAYADAIEAISAEIGHLERMATDYGSLASLPEPQIASFAFNAMVREIIALYRPQLDEFRVTESLCDGDAYMQGDPDRLREVVVNLMKNAIAFCPSGGEITVETTMASGRMRFGIANDTHNISVADIRVAKMPYVTTRRGGTGLGLAVSEKIIVDHRGSLRLTLDGDRVVARFDIPAVREED